MTDKAAFRRRLLGGGLLSLVMAVGLAVALEPTTPTAWLPVAWIGIGGLALLTAAGLERLPLGVVTIGWPRVAAVGLGILALGSSTFGFVQLLTEASSLSLIYAASHSSPRWRSLSSRSSVSSAVSDWTKRRSPSSRPGVGTGQHDAYFLSHLQKVNKYHYILSAITFKR